MLELLQSARSKEVAVVTEKDAEKLVDDYFFGKSNRNTKRLFHRAKVNARRKERSYKGCRS